MERSFFDIYTPRNVYLEIRHRWKKWLKTFEKNSRRTAASAGYDPGHASGVGHFYDMHHERFLQVYGSVIQAFRTRDIQGLLAYEMESMDLKDGQRLIDAGCGVAAPAVYFAQNAGLAIDAVTISQKQAEAAAANVAAAGMTDRVNVVCGDYHRMPELFPAGQYDGVYFLESFGHSRDKKRLIEACWTMLKPGGFLYIKDLFGKIAPEPGHVEKIEREIRKINHAYAYEVADLNQVLDWVRGRGFLLDFLKSISLDLDDFENLDISNAFQELTGIATIDDWGDYIFPVDFYELKCTKPSYNPADRPDRHALQNQYQEYLKNSMNDKAIEVTGLSKSYPRNALPVYHSLREDVRLWWRRLIGARGMPHRGTLDALKNIHFTLEKGDVLGVIGRNGAGKSTLLKILAGIMQPGAGTVTYRGRLVSILELGVGFHPDLTGRENVLLNGTLLGIPKKDIETRFDDIVAFSELGAAIDEPVKHYSSGMYLRLAFSVFTHFESDILLLDEVMAVGDLAFRQKSHRKIAALANAGATILIVSHDPEQIKSLCNKCLWIESGEMAAFGNPSEVVDAYIEKCFFRDTGLPLENGLQMERHQTIWKDGLRIQEEIILTRFSCKAAGKPSTNDITTTDDLEIEMEFEKCNDDREIEIGISLLSLYGAWVLVDSSGMYTKFDGVVKRSGRYRAKCMVPAGRINFGIYQLGILISRSEELIYQDQALLNLKIRYAEEPGVKGYLASNAEAW